MAEDYTAVNGKHKHVYKPIQGQKALPDTHTYTYVCRYAPCHHGCPDDDTMHIEGTARCAADTDPAQAIQHVGASIQIVGASIVLQIRQGQRLSDRDDMVWHTSRAFPVAE